MRPQTPIQREVRRINAAHLAGHLTNDQRHELIRKELNHVARPLR